jgi:hypothetical protein
VSKPGRMWLPLDASFTEDPRVLRAGEPAAWLYLAILGKIKRTGSRGMISRDEVQVLGIRNADRRLARLIDAGLLTVAPETDRLLIVPAWESWQPDESRAAYMRRWRARKADEERLQHNGSEPPDDDA